MKRLLFIIFGLTVFDAVLTCIGINLSFIKEANPLLKDLFRVTPEFAAFVIIAFVGMLLIIIYKFHRCVPWIRYGLQAILAIKLAVIGLHMIWICQFVNI
jgi:uncharacterized YccA/Bax inhibitor family protein